MLLVPAFVLAVVVPPPVVAIVVIVPVMVVLEASALTVPVATVVAALSIVWSYPDRASIRRTRPVALVPAITTLHRIPIAIDPQVLIYRTGAWRPNPYHARLGRCADLNSDGHLAERC